MAEFKTADSRTREKDVQQRTQRGLQYLNPEFGFQTFQPVDGDNSFRIVPPLADDKHATLWGFDVWVYYLGGRAYLSPSTFDKNAHDPVLEKYNQLKQTDAEAAKPFKGTKRSLTFVLDLNNTDEELKLWAAPTTVIDEVLKISKNRRSGELVAVEDPQNGRVIFFNKTGTGVATRYSAFQLDQAAMPLPPGLADQMCHFKELLIVPTTEELKQVIADMDENGGGDEGGSGGASGSRPTARTRRPDANEADTPAESASAPAAQAASAPTATATVAAAPQTQQTQEQPAAAPSTPAPTAAGGNSSDDLKSRVEARIAARKAAQQAG